MTMVRGDISNKLEFQAHTENDDELVSQECKNRGGTEPIKRLNKLRSIKVSRVRSFRQSRRSVNSRSDRISSILSGGQATPKRLSPIPLSDASPNYMKATSCSSARKENFQASPRNSESSSGSVDSKFFGSSNNLKPNAALLGQKSTRALIRRSTFKPVKGLTRMSSLISKRPSMKKYSGGAETKRKLKKSRSIKLAGFDSLRLPTGTAKNPYDRPSIASSALSKAHCQASPRNSGSGFSSNGRRKNWIVLNPNSGCGHKSLMRKSSLRPVRILTKMSSLKPRRSIQDRATCSSTLRNSKFPHHVELHPGGSESERTSVMKVCPYKYCSLNGHCHAPLPPLKPFLLKRRRQLKTQKTMKKRFSDLDKEIQAYKMAFIADSTAEKAGEEFFVEIYDRPRGKSTGEDSTNVGDEETKGDSGSQLSDFQAENCSIKKGSVSVVADRDSKEEAIVVTNLDNESYNSNVINDQPDSVSFCSLEEDGSELCNKQSSTLDDPESTSHEEVPVSGNVGVHEAGDDLPIAAGEPSCPPESPGPYDHAKSTTLNGVVSSAPDCGPLEKLTEGSEAKHGISEPGNGSFRDGESELPCYPNEAIESQLEKQKFIRMWRLIYQHAVSGPAAKVGPQPQVSLDGDACQDFGDREDDDAGCQKIELCQIDAIRLVEEAIDGIALPETPDGSSDDHQVTSDAISDGEFSDGKDKEGSIQASCLPAKEGFRELGKIQCTVADPEQTLVKDDNATVQINEKTIFKGEDKPGKEMRKSWSNLKKVILLKKFIKAVEKVRKFNPREPRYLPLEPKSEAEKIFLRHQEMYGRKNDEEWMLDYALQQVVSKLTPARRRKVALLVEAFEAISPLQDSESPLKPAQVVPFHAKPVQSSSGSSLQRWEEKGKEIRLTESAEQTGDSLTVAENIPVVVSPLLQETKLDCFCAGTELEKSVSEAADTDEEGEAIAAVGLDNREDDSTMTASEPDFSVIKDSGLNHNLSSKTEDSRSTCCKDIQGDGEILQEVHGETISNLKSEPCNGKSEENGKILEIGNLTDELAGTDKSSTEEEVNEKLDPDLQGNPPSGGSDPESNGAVYRTGMDKRRRNSMWYLIYQHMVSDIGANVESLPLLDESNKILPQGASETDPNKGTENHDASCCEETELRQSDAIKLVQEAIDRLLSPQIQDDSLDNPSNPSKTEDAEEGKAKSKVGNRAAVSKNWGHLKKLILLKRFVKSLEKVKKFNPRGPRFLASEPDPEAEKVNLRHQTTEDRKNSEEWMLDYALQQVVTKLSPARRRRVELLVEAFETVTPLSHSQIESQKRRTSASKALR